MPKTKRLRVFAGPNGSGKSTLFRDIKEIIPPALFVNADDIEERLSNHGFLDLKDFNLELNQEDFDLFCKIENAKTLIRKSEKLGHKIDISIKENIVVDKSGDSHSYEASLVASFIRENLRKSEQNFSFETVMSHVSKLEEIKAAKESGYRIYFYFVCLDDLGINISRVENRVEKGWHNVAPDKIVSRYSKTTENLLSALKLADRAYLFDNSDFMRLIAESHQGNLIIHYGKNSLPNWFIEYVLNKL